MKIGILTLPFNNNYGGYLQAIALMETLKSMGHEPTIINRRRNKPSLKQKLKYFALGVRGILLPSKKHPFFFDNEKDFYHRGRKMIPFADKYLQPRTSVIFNYNDLVVKGGGFDAYIVGSDQVWRPIYVPDIREYFFSFVNDKNAILLSYAASFGTNTPEYSIEQLEDCNSLLERFTAASLREESGLSVMNELGLKHNHVNIVLDPTMLLPKDFYIKNIGGQKDSKGRLFCYILDDSDSTNRIIDTISARMGEKPYYILDRENWKKNSYVMPSIEDWLNGIAKAEFVITDSYHGTVFSILFNKKFISIGNSLRGNDRFLSLLGKFELLSRLVTDTKEVDSIVEASIDWTRVNSILDKERAKSISFLHTYLDKQ